MKKISGKYRMVLKSGGVVPIIDFEERGSLLRVVVGRSSAEDFMIEDVGYIPLENIKHISAAEVIIDETTTRDIKRVEEIRDITAEHGPTVIFEASEGE